MATDLVASRLLVRTAADAIDNSLPNAAILAAMAKLQATDKCFDVMFVLLFFGTKFVFPYCINGDFKEINVNL